MNDHGYTLSEALTALLMIALALGGIAQAVHVLSAASIRLERDRQRLESLAEARDLFRGLPDNLGPFVAGDDPARRAFSGSEYSMRFVCGYAGSCSVSLEPRSGKVELDVTSNGRARAVRLTPLTGLRLQYVSAIDGVVSSSWPIRPADRLGAVDLDDGETTLAVLPLSNAQDAACAFDLQRGGCVQPNGAIDVGR
jgi:hypothetical protein